ncbi:MAG: hypothetical protein KDC34_13075 [Saprospiraceae bacterium]|nr:hypothetical protein [Saprospiraceae bacterium]
MRNFFSGFFLFCASLTVSAQADWQSFIAIDAGFRIKTPVSLELVEDSLQTDIGLVIHKTYYGQSEENRLVFLIHCYDYPEFTVHSDSTELLAEFFEATLEEAIAAVDGELKYNSPVSQQNYPGQRYRIDYLDGQASIKTQAVMIRNRFISVQVASPADLLYADLTTRFLDSFEVLE